MATTRSNINRLIKDRRNLTSVMEERDIIERNNKLESIT